MLLSYQTEKFFVIREATTYADCARHILPKYCIKCEKDLFESTDSYHFGKGL